MNLKTVTQPAKYGQARRWNAQIASRVNHCPRCSEYLHRETISRDPVILLSTCPRCKYTCRTQTTGHAVYGYEALSRILHADTEQLRLTDVMSSLRTELWFWLTLGACFKRSISTAQ